MLEILETGALSSRTTTHSKVLRCIEARQAVQAMGWVTVSEVGMRLG